MRWLGRMALVTSVLGLLFLGGVLLLSSDPSYRLSHWGSLGRYERYLPQIEAAARKHGVDPLLIRAVVWQESRFHPDKTGTVGERGLMQVGEAAAADWVRVHKVETFVPTDLFSPTTNLEIGTWYLARALNRWKDRDDPIPFALAEYNAGKTRADRWVGEISSETGRYADAGSFLRQIDFPMTRAYIEAISGRYRWYQTTEKTKSGASPLPSPTR